MQVAILAGGKGTRLAEETHRVPKPMVEIGGKPILWHIVQHYAAYGFRDFVVAAGYLGEVIQNFADSGQFSTPGYATPGSSIRGASQESVRVRVEDTGSDTNTGGRVRRLAHVIGQERFMLTWGDGLSDVDLHALLDFHRSHGRLATVTAVLPPPRFGRLTLDEDRVTGFEEKPRSDGGWINGAYFILEPAVFEMLDGDDCSFERDLMVRLAKADQLRAFRHEGFWQCMDNISDRDRLRCLWETGNAPWMKQVHACV